VNINNISITVNQVAPHVYRTPFLVDIALATWTFLEIWCSIRVHVDLTLNSLDVEFGEGENLWEFTRLEVCLLPQLSARGVNYIARSINQVALFVNLAPKVVE
jgi:hypothetical protein